MRSADDLWPSAVCLLRAIQEATGDMPGRWADVELVHNWCKQRGFHKTYRSLWTLEKRGLLIVANVDVPRRYGVTHYRSSKVAMTYGREIVAFTQEGLVECWSQGIRPVQQAA